MEKPRHWFSEVAHGDSYPVRGGRKDWMEIEWADETDGPSLIAGGMCIPFQMEAHVSYGPADGGQEDDWSDWDDDAPWMIRLPVEAQVMLPHEVLYPPAPPRPALPAPEHADPDPDPGSGTGAWGSGAIPLPRVRGRKRPVSLRTLQSLRMDERIGQRIGSRSGGIPDLAGLVFPTAADAGDPTDAADDWHPPATGTVTAMQCVFLLRSCSDGVFTTRTRP